MESTSPVATMPSDGRERLMRDKPFAPAKRSLCTELLLAKKGKSCIHAGRRLPAFTSGTAPPGPSARPQ
jgi:hypothetical protein